MEASRKAVARDGEYVVMLGQMLATTAVRVMREDSVENYACAAWKLSPDDVGKLRASLLE